MMWQKAQMNLMKSGSMTTTQKEWKMAARSAKTLAGLQQLETILLLMDKASSMTNDHQKPLFHCSNYHKELLGDAQLGRSEDTEGKMNPLGTR